MLLMLLRWSSTLGWAWSDAAEESESYESEAVGAEEKVSKKGRIGWRGGVGCGCTEVDG